MIVRIQGEEVKWTEGMPDSRRVQAYKCHRAGTTPLLVLNIYMPAGQLQPQKEHRMALTRQTIEWAVSTGYAFMILGDWNAEQDEEIPSELTTRGNIQRADQQWAGQIQTTTSGEGDRVIDYALYWGEISISERRQARAHSKTHDYVAYQVGIGGRLDAEGGGKRKNWEIMAQRQRKSGGVFTGQAA